MYRLLTTLCILILSAVAESLFEGDIVLSPFDLKFVDTREEGDVDGDLEPSRRKRNTDRNRRRLWHDKIVPYKFDPRLPGKNSLSHGIKHRRQIAWSNYLMCECFVVVVVVVVYTKKKVPLALGSSFIKDCVPFACQPRTPGSPEKAYSQDSIPYSL